MKIFTDRDGIAPGMSCSYSAVILPDGEIWMAGSGGITSFYPDRIVDNPYQGPVHITKLTQWGKPLRLGMAPERVEKITLHWDENFFEFEMAALSYRRPEKNQYRYMLEGVDKDWYDAGEKRSGRYSGLAAGTYTLRVRGSNNDGVWSSRETTLAITITPPWWGSWWFRGTVLAALLSLAFTTYQLRVKSIRQRNLELARQVNERTHELQLAKSAAEYAGRAAETANKAKSVFLANMSHELRTPLNAILGFSSLMRREPDVSESQREKLDIINRSGEHLLRLIDDVLEIAKIEAGRLQLDIAPFDLGAMVRDVTDLMRLRAGEKGLKLQVDQSSAFPRYIKGDEARLRQMLVNLTGNAIKFTKQGSVTIRLGLKQNAQPHLVIEVEDTGPGIRAENQKRLFKPFVQLGEATTQKGTGLGLTISRQFAELMGGTIGVTSKVGKGSIFRIDLPIEKADAAAIVALQRPAAAGEVTGLAPGTPRYRILIAEDQLENQLLLSQLMTSVGLDVKVAANGRECVELFQEWHPHLIWMDRRMPVMDGMEAARRIRSLPGGRDVKIAAVTASAFKDQQQEMLDAGMDNFLRKPYRLDEIYECLARLLGAKYTYEAEPAEAAAAPAELEPTMLTALPAALRRELGEALESLDSDRIKAAIRRASEIDAALARTLSQLTENFDYPIILKALAAEKT